MDFLIKENKNDKAVSEDQIPQHMVDYLGSLIKTKLRRNIDEEDILVFDQNFECGNLDSVYLHS